MFFFFLKQLLPYQQQALQQQQQNADRIIRFQLLKERINNFLSMPLMMEKLLFFGGLLCLDTFLGLYTILPLRCFYIVIQKIRSPKKKLNLFEKKELLKFSMFLFSACLIQFLDASRLYHSIRGQAVIKLYVIFNVLEIGDRLCCSFGQDILESLLSQFTLMEKQSTGLNPILHFLLAIGYIFLHSLLLFYQVITLNVAINSHNNALFTLLVSNQFVEIKGSVFKKFEKENLFQLNCSDIVERFQLFIFLYFISLRNLFEFFGEDLPNLFQNLFYAFIQWPFMSISTILTNLFSLDIFNYKNFEISELPYLLYSFGNQLLAPFSTPLDLKIFSEFSPFSPLSQSSEKHFTLPSFYFAIFTLLGPLVIVYASEMLVDWLKHAFITKFNGMRPKIVYQRFYEVLLLDYVQGQRLDFPPSIPNMEIYLDQPKTFQQKMKEFLLETSSDRSEAVAKRLGFQPMPLGCLFIPVVGQVMASLDWRLFSDSNMNYVAVALILVMVYAFIFFLKWATSQLLLKIVTNGYYELLSVHHQKQLQLNELEKEKERNKNKPPFHPMHSPGRKKKKNKEKEKERKSPTPTLPSPSQSPTIKSPTATFQSSAQSPFYQQNEQLKKPKFHSLPNSPAVKRHSDGLGIHEDELSRVMELDPHDLKKDEKEDKLESIDRYTMFKSRIP